MKIKKFLKIMISIVILNILIYMCLPENVVTAFTIGNLSGNTTGTLTVQTAGNKVVQIVSTVGSILSVIVIIVLGIKYMMGSVEERADYKKTMLPYLIGAAFIFAASNIANIIYQFAINI